MVVAIPAAQVLSNMKKESQFADASKSFDLSVFLHAGIIDLILFGCIIAELFMAAIYFYCLSRIYDIKFQIQQVLIHIAMIVSIILSRLAAFNSEGMSV